MGNANLKGALGCSIILALSLVPASALATGGSTIASAPTVIFGQQEFGNTVTDQGSPPNCDSTRGPGRSWRKLPVIAGDHVTLDLEGQTQGDGFVLEVYPIGTNDFNVAGRQAYASTVDSQRDKEELVFAAPSSGTMPIDVASCDSIGTYDLTAYVKHSVVLSLPRLSSITRHGAIRVAVHNPGGGAVSDPGLRIALEIRTDKHKRWTTAGTASVTNSVATVGYNVPRRIRSGRVAVRASASGADYFTRSSATRTARLK